MAKLTNEITSKVFTRAYRGYDEHEVDTFLDDIVAEIEGYEREIERLRSMDGGHGSGEDAADKPAVSFSQQVQGARDLLNEAIDDAKRIVDIAQQEADRIAADAKAKAEQATRKALQEAEQLLADARAQAEQEIRDARSKANDILAQAGQSVPPRRRQADAEAPNSYERNSARSYSYAAPDRFLQSAQMPNNDTVDELSRRILELTQRLESIEHSGARAYERAPREDNLRQDLRNEDRESSPRDLHGGPQRSFGAEQGRSAEVLSAFGRENPRSVGKTPWQDWLPGAGRDTMDDEGKGTGTGEWNIVD